MPSTTAYAQRDVQNRSHNFKKRTHGECDVSKLRLLGSVLNSWDSGGPESLLGERQKNGGSTKYRDDKASLKEAIRPSPPPQRSPKTTPEAPQEAAHTTPEDAKRVTREGTAKKNRTITFPKPRTTAWVEQK